MKPTLYEISQRVLQAKAELARKVPRALVLTQRKLIAAVEALASEVERLQKESSELRQWREQYEMLVIDWNTANDAIGELGIEVYSPFPTDQWVWRCTDGATGIEQTAGAAMAAALRYRLGNKEENMATTDLALYTFTKGQSIQIDVYDPEGPPAAPEYDLRGKVTKIEKADGITRVYVWGDDQRFILVLPGEV